MHPNYFRSKPISQAIRTPLAYCGIYPPDSKGQHPISWRSYMILSVLGLYSALSGAYLIFEASSFKSYADCYWITSTAGVVFFVCIVLVVKRKNLFELIDNFDKIIEQRVEEDPRSTKIFGDSIELIAKLLKLFDFALRRVTFLAVMLPNFVISLHDYYTTDLGGAAFVLPFSMWLPFNYDSLSGYILAYVIQLSCSYCILQSNVCNFSLFTLSILILMAFADDIKMKSKSLTVKHEDGTNQSTRKRQIVLISSFVVLHTRVLQIVNDLLEIYEFYITAVFLWCLSTICCSLLAVQLEISQSSGSLIEIVRPLILSYWSFCTLFVFCHFGQMVANRFENIDEALYENEWYHSSIEIQRMLRMIINITQDPVVIHGFGNLLFTYESFEKVVNAGFSFFTCFRSIEN